MESAVRVFQNIFQTPGSTGCLSLGVVIGFLILRLWPKNGTATGVLSLVGLPVAGGGIASGLVGYLLEKKLFAYLDAYGIGLLIGFGINIIFRILAGLLEGLANALKQIAGASAVIRAIGSIVRFLTTR